MVKRGSVVIIFVLVVLGLVIIGGASYLLLKSPATVDSSPKVVPAVIEAPVSVSSAGQEVDSPPPSRTSKLPSGEVVLVPPALPQG